MKKEQEKKIIRAAVRQAVANFGLDTTREDVARSAALKADKKGVNIQTAPYLQDIFYDALDEFF